jgi:hypothetical protein
MKLDLKKLMVVSGIVFSGLVLNSCLNDNGDVVVPDEGGYVAFINTSPDSDGLTFYTNDNLINANSTEYSEYFGYLLFEPGTHNISVNSGGGDLDTISLNVDLNKFYSVFAVDDFEHLKLIAYEDNFISPSAGKAAIRFIQLSPDAPQLKVALQDNDGSIGSTFDFMQSSSFLEVNSSVHKSLYLIDAESNDTIFTKQVDFDNGGVYSVFSKGFYETDNANQQLDVQVIPFQ